MADFAFVIHPLSHKDFTYLPGFGSLQYMPSSWNDTFDRLASLFPPFVYGSVKHVISESNGVEVSGLIYALPVTPKVFKNTQPEVFYRKIEKICYDAADRGAKIIGLGAYTKIFGDQGITIHKNSPIPVTTGNSFTASATLWALHDVSNKMGILQKDPDSGLFDGAAMVIGATGSIGQVSSKLLSLVFKKIYLVAPKKDRLQLVKKSIEAISPQCQVIATTNSNEFAPQADVVVTATSAFDEKILDVMRLKTGAIICDCSLPSDFDAEDVKKRPDILVINSGEVILPGPLELDFDLGLAQNAVYACIAETAILAMEGRYEPFTLGRDIDYKKVKEVYKLARRHGVKLAPTHGQMGVISDQQIQFVRKLALANVLN